MRNAPRVAAAILTVLLHLLVLAPLVRISLDPVKPPPRPAEPALTADTLHGAGEQVISVGIGSALSPDGLACAGSSYVGVGVTAEPGSERIILVGDNTPASRAGLQHGDIVLNPAVWRDAHIDGTVLSVLI
ncbi:MAG: hypothetical protein ABIV63_06105, partial [Caldimonas sp.]